VRGDLGLNQLLAVGAKRGESSGLVTGHQQAVSNHVGCEYRREPALDSFCGYGALSSKNIGGWFVVGANRERIGYATLAP
jgi:hypothetical protein